MRRAKQVAVDVREGQLRRGYDWHSFNALADELEDDLITRKLDPSVFDAGGEAATSGPSSRSPSSRNA